MDVSENRGTPKSSILIGFSIINHPFWGTPVFGNTHMEIIPSNGFLLSQRWKMKIIIFLATFKWDIYGYLISLHGSSSFWKPQASGPSRSELARLRTGVSRDVTHPKKKNWKEMGGTLLSGGPVPRFWAMIFVLYVSYCLSLVLTNRLSSTSLHPRFCWNSSLNLGHFHLAKLGNSDTVIHTHRQQSACIVACGFCFLCHMQMNKFPIWESISVFQPKS